MQNFEKEYKEELEVSEILYLIIQIIEGRNTDTFGLEKYRKKRIAIYGIGKIGISLLALFVELKIDVSFFIDRRDLKEWKGYTVYRPWEEIPPVDCVVVSTQKCFCEIKDKLEMLGVDRIISAKAFLFELSHTLAK